jgi:hypothetical protein
MSDYAEHDLPKAQHEPRDVGSRTIFLGLSGILATLLLLAGLAVWLYPRSLTDKTITRPLPDPAAPRLQQSPAADMRAFYAREIKELNSVGWVDRAHGIVHMPIDEAMRLVAKEGIPDWPTTPHEQAQR